MRNMSISELAAGSWRVSFDGYDITFATEAEARAYVDQLRTRLAQPHVWPTGADESPLSGDQRPKS